MPIFSRKIHKVSVTHSADEKDAIDLKIEASAPDGEKLMLELTMTQYIANQIARQLAGL